MKKQTKQKGNKKEPVLSPFIYRNYFLSKIVILIIPLSFLFTLSFVPQRLSKKFENLKFVFILKSVISLNRYHNQYLHKLLTVSFCFLIFVVYLVIVKFIIYSIQACNFYIDNCTVF